MKTGTLVKVVKQIHGHEFPIGEIVRFKEFADDSLKFEYLDGHDYWYLTEEEFEIVEEQQ